MKNTGRLLALLLAISLVAVACGDSDDSTETTSAPTTTAVEEATDDAAASDDAADDAAADDDAMEDEAMADIVDTAVGAGTFTILAAALEQAGLVDTLKGEGPFTVFAPTDDAFAAALETLGITAEELLADPTLGSILTYHVVTGKVLAADVVGLDGQSVATVNGGDIMIEVTEAGGVTINGIAVTTTDIEASNGVIHVIDGVLLP